jgi:hypothetical protein
MKNDGQNDSPVEVSTRESQVNELLDGELDKASTDALKQAASDDQDLAQLIVESYELQRDMDQLGIERAPRSLRKKLAQIPRAQRPVFQRRRWVAAAALASIPVLAISLVLMQPQQPSASEIEKARQDLAVAFTYIDRVGSRTGSYLNSVLGTELRQGVTDNISKHFPYTENPQEENS